MSRQMNYLLPGREPLKKIELIISLTQLSSPGKEKALIEHYVNGLPASRAAARFGIDKGNLSTAKSTLEEVAAVIEQIKELDWSTLNSKPSTNDHNSHKSYQLTDAVKQDGAK